MSNIRQFLQNIVDTPGYGAFARYAKSNGKKFKPYKVYPTLIIKKKINTDPISYVGHKDDAYTHLRTFVQAEVDRIKEEYPGFDVTYEYRVVEEL